MSKPLHSSLSNLADTNILLKKKSFLQFSVPFILFEQDKIDIIWMH